MLFAAPFSLSENSADDPSTFVYNTRHFFAKLDYIDGTLDRTRVAGVSGAREKEEREKGKLRKVKWRKPSGSLPTAFRDWRGIAEANQRLKCKMQKNNVKIKNGFRIKCGMTDVGLILCGGRFLDSAPHQLSIGSRLIGAGLRSK
ncbi:MAG: hypothetical protein FVQ85_00540 [Planctomycetes bacterium]|nr:hypothetical protein [Planctomycetota bacterium]